VVTAVLHPFRFGACVTHTDSRRAWTELARRIEDLGYAALQLPDHFGAQFGIGPALGVAAAVTTTLRIGCTVYVLDFHHPTWLAKEVATLDLLSDGRMECGLGAGWNSQEYAAVGAFFDAAPNRVSRVEEAVAVLKALWTGDRTTFAGRFYRITDYPSHPRPVQTPHPPIMIGGAGRRMLSLAGREAQIVSFVQRAQRDGTLAFDSDPTAALADRVAVVDKAAVGRAQQPVKHVLIWNVTVSASARPSPVPYQLSGSIDGIVERLYELRETLGLSYFSIPEQDLDAFAPVVARLAGR
jgi:probable F420-dependent oxidoreductase